MAGVDAESEPRRRGPRPPSARSLLLTLLGEFVLPRNAPAWTKAIVTAFADIDVEEKAARQALARTAAEGLLSADREGRRVRWQLTPAGTQLLVAGTERIYGFGRRLERWDGQWLVLAVSVPETQRQLRHRLRTRLTWAGLGSPMPGLWVSPDTSKEKEVAAAIEELGVASFSFHGPFGQIGDEQQVVHAAWALEDVERGYHEFVETVSQQRPVTPAARFAAQVRLVQEWRRFPFLDPALPPELLAATWPGPAAADLFHRRHAEWHEDAQAHWADLCARAAARI
jgi:phenylacetic acid degradation operon negative regulatory protein